MKTFILVLAVGLAPPVLAGTTSDEILAGYGKAAGDGFAGFSAERGRQLFTAEHPSDDAVTACTSCHGSDLMAEGRHQRTKRRIKPLAPSANTERLTNAYKVEKWFGRNCRDVLGRECTPMEKGDVMTWLLSIK
jgi:cytochrome c553